MYTVSVVGKRQPRPGRTLNIISDAPSVHRNCRESRKFRKGIEPHMKGSSTLRARDTRGGLAELRAQVARSFDGAHRDVVGNCGIHPSALGRSLRRCRTQDSRVRTPRSLFRCCRNAGKPSTRTSRQPYRKKSLETAPTANGTEPIARCAVKEHVHRLRTSWTQKISVARKD